MTIGSNPRTQGFRQHVRIFRLESLEGNTHSHDECGLATVNHLIWKHQFGVATKRKCVTSHYHCLFACKDDRQRRFDPYCRFDKEAKTRSGGSAHYEDKEDVWTIDREYWNGAIKTPAKLPAELIEKILAYSSREGDIVMDPFIGSGQVAVVSKMQGRRYVGFEIVPEYYEFARDRLASGKYLIPAEKQPENRNPFSHSPC